MKNFKKILTLLILLIGITSQAQIRQDILGTTLGITTKQRAARIILDKGYGISGSGNIMTVHDADFAGYIWNEIKFYFLNDKLYKIVFTKPDLQSEHNTLGPFTPDATIFSSIEQNLNQKYAKFKQGNNYSDGKTKIIIDSSQMIYENINLSNKANNSSIDDL